MVSLHTQKIQVLVEYLTKGQQKLAEATKNFQSMGGVYQGVTRGIVSSAQKQSNAQDILARKQKFFSDWSNKLGTNTARVSQIMAYNGYVFDKMGKVTDKAGKSIQNLNRGMVEGRRKTKPFRMELLSVMFFGMMLYRTLTGLIKTSLEWMGVNEILTLSLGLLFLPIAEFLLDYALKFLTWVTDLSEGEKKLIGWVVLLGIALAGALFLFGQFGLGLAGLEAVGFLGTTKGISGIGTAAKTANGKVGDLKTKVKSLVKVAAVAILVSIAVKDLKEDQLIAAVGGLTMAGGIIKGGKAGGAVFLIGAGLKLFGDEEFMITVIKIMYKIGDFISSILKEAIMSGLTMKAFDPSKIEGLANVKRAFNIAAEQLSMEKAMKGIGDSIMYPTEQINKLRDEQSILKEQLELGFDTSASIDALEEQIKELEGKYDLALNKVRMFREEAEKPIKINSIWGSIGTSMLKGRALPSFLQDLLGFQHGGVVPGTLNSPVPIMAHAGETVIPVGGNKGQGVAMNITYNITGVSSPQDIKNMLEESNRKLTQEITRSVKI